MKFINLLLLLAFLPSCATSITVEENKRASEKDEEPMLDIQEAIATDAIIVSRLLSAVGHLTKPRESSTQSGMDADCSEPTETKICSLNDGCWCKPKAVSD